MLTKIKYIIDECSENEPGGVCGFFVVLIGWWRGRPKRSRCMFCKRPIWVSGRPNDEPAYCSEGCLNYGDADLPF